MRKQGFAITIAFCLLLSACSLKEDGRRMPTDGQEQGAEAVSYDISIKEIAGVGQNLASLFTSEERIFGISTLEDGSRSLYIAGGEEIWQGTSACLNMKKLELDVADDRQQLIVFAGIEGGFYTVEEQAGENFSYYLCKYGTDGSRQRECDITETWGAEAPILFAAVADDEGRVYLSRGGGSGNGNSVLVLDGEGSLLVNIQTEDVVVSRLAAIDDRAYCVLQRDGEDVLCRVNAENGLLQEEITLTEGRGNVKMMTATSESLWLSDYEGVKEYQPETGELRALFNWVDAGVNGGKVEAILAQDESHIGAVVVMEGEQYLLLLKEKGVLESEAAAPGLTIKEQVIIQGEDSDADLKRLVTLFNLQSEEYEVEIRSYDESRLGAELVVGNGPDLLNVSSGLDLRSAFEEMLRQSQLNRLEPPTDEDLEAIRKLIDSASFRDTGSVVDEIIFEELDACFVGDRSVDDTVEIIQNRVQLYLDEM